MSSKKREIIFEAPKASIPPSVLAMMEGVEQRLKKSQAEAEDLDVLGAPLEIDIHIQNAKVLFSMPGSKLAGLALARLIIKAVQEYELKPVTVPPRKQTSARVGEPVITYERYVCIDWKQKLISTNFPPHEGEAFLGAMAIIVEELQGGDSTKEQGS